MSYKLKFSRILLHPVYAEIVNHAVLARYFVASILWAIEDPRNHAGTRDTQINTKNLTWSRLFTGVAPSMCPRKHTEILVCFLKPFPMILQEPVLIFTISCKIISL